MNPMENHQYELLRQEIKSLRELLSEQIQGLRGDYKRIEDANETLQSSLQDQYVSQSDFRPVRTIVYGMVAVMLMAVLTAILAKVVQK
jgi:hypothetical protein